MDKENIHPNILLISRNFPPLTGGMENMMFHTYLEINKYSSCWLVGPIGCAKYTNNLSKTAEAPAKPVFLFLLIAFFKSLFLCIKIRPAIIIGGSGVVAPIVVVLAKLFRIKSLIFIHGLDLIKNHNLYQKIFVPIIRRSDFILTNSINTRNLAIEKGVSHDKLDILHPGVNTTISSLTRSNYSLRTKLKINETDILLSVGRLIPRKGIAEFIENSLINLLEQNPKIRLIIIGDEPSAAINKHESVKQKINHLIAKYGLEEKIFLLGKVDSEILQIAYQESDAFIFPLIEVPGDVEGFGMVALEAASFGLPVFAFNVGGVRDAIVDQKTGFLVQPKNYDLLTQLIAKYFQRKNQLINSHDCINHARQFSWDNYGNSLRQLLSNIQTSL